MSKWRIGLWTLNPEPPEHDVFWPLTRDALIPLVTTAQDALVEALDLLEEAHDHRVRKMHVGRDWEDWEERVVMSFLAKHRAEETPKNGEVIPVEFIKRPPCREPRNAVPVFSPIVRPIHEDGGEKTCIRQLQDQMAAVTDAVNRMAER